MINSDLLIHLTGVLWGNAIDFLVERGVPREEAGVFADKLSWEIMGLLDYV